MKKLVQFLSMFLLVNVAVIAEDDWFEDDFFKEFSDSDFKNMFSFSYVRPFIDLNIGLNTINVDSKSYDNKFNDIGNFNGKFGYSKKKSILESKSVYRGSNNYLFVDYSNKDLPLSTTTDLFTNSKIFQIGLGDDDFYAYKFGESIDIEFTNNSSFGWNWLTFNSIDLDTNNIKYLDYMSDGMRFSNNVGNDLKILIDDSYGISAGFDRTIIYQRHLFWYWAGSEILFSAGSNMIDWFTKSIAKRNNAAAPIVYFILHSAYNYGMYELRKEKMNWPIETSPGFIVDNFKVGISVKF